MHGIKHTTNMRFRTNTGDMALKRRIVHIVVFTHLRKTQSNEQKQLNWRLDSLAKAHIYKAEATSLNAVSFISSLFNKKKKPRIQMSRNKLATHTIVVVFRLAYRSYEPAETLNKIHATLNAECAWNFFSKIIFISIFRMKIMKKIIQLTEKNFFFEKKKLLVVVC